MDVVGMAEQIRVGLGYDVHALAAGEDLIVGGVAIEHELGTVAHSDGDVLTHAIIDALLGATADGDIGSHYPDTDERWKGVDSIDLLKDVAQRLASSGCRVGNIDATVALQRPKLRPHIDTMRSRIADALQIDMGAVSVKATTTEKLGFEGRQEGISAYAIAAVFVPLT
jgi:2-C-methyl-D-erythritol 2,4-cyclodiphosphate synthase